MNRQVVQIEDAWSDPLYEVKENAKLGGVRSMIGVPLMREGEPIGVLGLARTQVEPFVEREVELVRTFADQAVIAIENARLLNELRERTDQLQAQSKELAELNQQLEQCVFDQVGEIERMGRLRRFLPPQVADLIVASGSEKQLESHRREITALFCDLRGFTGFTESADAEDVMALLRDYHAAIGEIIIKYNGTLERYAGDGVMVVFNDPVPVENPALQAVLMALEVRDAIGALTETWRRWGHDIGFGNTWSEWSCSQLLQNTPLHPIAEWGRQRFGGTDVPAEERLADLESSLAQVKLDPMENLPLLAPLLDIPLPSERMPPLPPEEVRRRQLAALTNWVMAGARSQPIVLALEDMHWADPTTLDVLRGIAERGALAPLLVLITSRPEFRPPWGARSHHSTIFTGPARPRSSAAHGGRAIRPARSAKTNR